MVNKYLNKIVVRKTLGLLSPLETTVSKGIEKENYLL